MVRALGPGGAIEGAVRARDEARTNLSNLQVWIDGWESAFADQETLLFLDDFLVLNQQIQSHLDAGEVTEAFPYTDVIYSGEERILTCPGAADNEVILVAGSDADGGPSFLVTMVLPIDLDIFMPFSSSVKP